MSNILNLPPDTEFYDPYDNFTASILDPEPEDFGVEVSPDPAPADPDPLPAPAPVVQEPVQVIPVQDLLDILAAAGADESDADAALFDEAGADGAGEPAAFTPIVYDADGDAVEVVGVQQLLESLELVRAELTHPAMETPFSDYSVTEALLLLTFLFSFLRFTLDLLRRWF